MWCLGSKNKNKKNKKNGRVGRSRLWSEKKWGKELRNEWEDGVVGHCGSTQRKGKNLVRIGEKNVLVVVRGVLERVGEKLRKKNGGLVVCG